MRSLIVALVVSLAACSPAADTCFHRTALGLCLEGAVPTDAQALVNVDTAWAEAQDCWGIQVDGTLIMVHYEEGVWPHTRWNDTYVPPDVGYGTLRHEFSHVVGGRIYGALPPDGYDRCWL